MNVFSFRHTIRYMSRNSASGANKQRRRPQRENTDAQRRRQFKPQPGRPDPNLRFDDRSTHDSFAHLERTKEPTIAVGLEGWKTQDKQEIQVEGENAHD